MRTVPYYFIEINLGGDIIDDKKKDRMDKKQIMIVATTGLFCIFGAGCFALPFQIAKTVVGVAGSVAGKVVNLAQSLPKPPPWVFF